MFSWQGLGPSAWVVARRKSPEQDDLQPSGNFRLQNLEKRPGFSQLVGRSSPIRFRPTESQLPTTPGLAARPTLVYSPKEPLAKRHAGLRSRHGKTPESSQYRQIPAFYGAFFLWLRPSGLRLCRFGQPSRPLPLRSAFQLYPNPLFPPRFRPPALSMAFTPKANSEHSGATRERLREPRIHSVCGASCQRVAKGGPATAPAQTLPANP